MLMAHTDVVPAPAEDWTSPPFDGALRDGRSSAAAPPT